MGLRHPVAGFLKGAVSLATDPHKRDVSFAKETYKRDIFLAKETYCLQKKCIFCRRDVYIHSLFESPRLGPRD